MNFNISIPCLFSIIPIIITIYSIIKLNTKSKSTGDYNFVGDFFKILWFFPILISWLIYFIILYCVK